MIPSTAVMMTFHVIWTKGKRSFTIYISFTFSLFRKKIISLLDSDEDQYLDYLKFCAYYCYVVQTQTRTKRKIQEVFLWSDCINFELLPKVLNIHKLWDE